MSMGLNSFGLDAFYICAQEKNFTRASERLHITQSALSQRIKNLEEEVGTTLFIRDRIGVRLTEQGESLLRYCSTREQLEQELTNFITGSSNQISGNLRIGGFSSIMRSLVLLTCKILIAEQPKIQLTLISKEIFELPDLLRNSTVDFAVTDHSIEREGIKSIFLGHEINVRVRKKGSAFTNRFLDHDERDETTLKYLKLKSGTKINRHYMDDIYGIIDGVQLGLGDAIIPQHLLKAIKGLEVVDEKNTLKNPVFLNFYDHPVQTKLFAAFKDKIISESKNVL
jgi:DNA-binding transcriptional LysR family regulator